VLIDLSYTNIMRIPRQRCTPTLTQLAPTLTQLAPTLTQLAPTLTQLMINQEPDYTGT